jgi:hypothetical protein
VAEHSARPDGATAYTREDRDRAARMDLSVGDLVGRVTSDVSTLLRQELELAKAEVKRDVADTGKAAGAFGGGGVAGLLMLIFVSLTAMFALDNVMPSWVAALIVGLIWGGVALTLFLVGRNKMRVVDLTPERTIQTVKEDVQWAKTRGK